MPISLKMNGLQLGNEQECEPSTNSVILDAIYFYKHLNADNNRE